MAKEKVLSEMSKTEILEYAIIRAASVSEMIFQAKENIKTVEVDNEERMRRFNMEEGETLLDFIKADDKSDPEILLITKAEEEASRPYTELMIKQVTERLPPSQRKKFLEAFGG